MLASENGALGDLGAQELVLSGVLEEVDKLHDFNLGLLAARHVDEAHVDVLLLDNARRALRHPSHSKHTTWPARPTPASRSRTATSHAAHLQHTKQSCMITLDKSIMQEEI